MLEIGVKVASLALVRSSLGRRRSPLKLDADGLEASYLSIDAIAKPSRIGPRCSYEESVKLDENHRCRFENEAKDLEYMKR